MHDPKKSPNFVRLYLCNEGMYRQSEEKLVKQQYPHMSSQYGKLRPINGWDLLASLGHPSKFQRVSRLAFVTAVMSLTGGQPNFAWCLSISWAGISIYTFWGALAPNRILPAAKFTLHLSLAFAYIGSVATAQLSSSGRQQNFSALSRGRHLCGALTLGIGPHSSFDFVFSVLVKNLARKSIFEMTYFVWSGM